MKYAIVIEHEGNAWGAYIPDLPGCIATGKNEVEVRRCIQEALAIHLKSMKEDGDEIPEPSTQVEYAIADF